MTNIASIYVDSGTDFQIRLSASLVDGDDFDIRDFSFFCHVKKVYSEIKKFEIVVTPEKVGDENFLVFSIDKEKTRDLEPGKYNYDVLSVNQEGKVDKILGGILYLIPTNTIIETNSNVLGV
jgi:hypothetical protein